MGKPVENNIYARHQQMLDAKKIINEQQVGSARVFQQVPARHNSNLKLNHNAAKKPIIVRNSQADDFMRRKEEFIKNRARGKGFLNNPLVNKPPLAAKKDEKSMYEERLKQIRQKNFNNRKSLLQDRQEDPNSRLMRLAALKVIF